MKKTLFVPVMPGLALCSGACSSDTGENARFSVTSSIASEKNRIADHSDRFMDTKLNIRTDTGVVHARLYDNALAKDFIAMLPLTLTPEDFNKTEKIALLPERLSTAGTPSGYTPHRSDIAFYVPWGNLCIFYRDFRYSPDLISLGKIDSDDMSILEKAHTVTISVDARQ